MVEPAGNLGLELRSAQLVMRLDRLGAFHQTRLSFLRVLLRRAIAEKWTFTRPRFDIDDRGVGTAVYAVQCAGRTYSLVAFGHDLPADQRTDRVIAEAWDATFALFDGVPSDEDIGRLAANVPRQEAGRYAASELVLARANRSVRLFEHTVERLARGLQPDAEALVATGYLMRTTAVYGNGKFGIADRDVYLDRPELVLPFQAEMLTVYLIRAFTADLVEHMARRRAPATATTMAPDLRRRLGIGNATGLGMAPFLVRHPALIDRWMTARETALGVVRAQDHATRAAQVAFRRALAAGQRMVAGWSTDDAVQAPRIVQLADDLGRLATYAETAWEAARPWDLIYTWAEQNLSLEGQEFTVTLLLEPHGALIDDLAMGMVADEDRDFRIDGRRTVADVSAMVEAQYGWALDVDFDNPAAVARFWYVSEEKLEPRLGDRHREAGGELEQPLAVARDMRNLYAALGHAVAEQPIAEFLMRWPLHRHTVRRLQVTERHPFAEIRDNLIGDGLRPVDILRCKLAFFGATRFDPKSDKWLRITLFQNAPYPSELGDADWDGWIWGAS